jgi:hypothetical protein
MSRVSAKLRDVIIQTAKNRCGYCRTPQNLVPIPFEIEHILPKAAGGTDDEENLWLSCGVCNSFKHAKTHAVDPITKEEVRIFNPRTQDWNEHFEFSSDNSEILGKTVCGRATAAALKLNNPRAVKMRKLWASVGWFPPEN